MQQIMDYEVKVCKREDRDYPRRFEGLRGMPERIYYAGNISLLNIMPGVAIIGSRKCSDEALIMAREAGRMAAEAEIAVINGLALGCDTEALIGTLEQGGKCIVVLPGGMNRVYPQSNEGLMQEIIERGGCVISEYAPDAEPKKFTFVERDRLQSALSKGILVIAAGMGSGTMETVRAAGKQGRRVAAYSTKIVEMEGNRHVIDKGAAEISSMEDLQLFFKEVKEEVTYHQMSFFDVM